MNTITISSQPRRPLLEGFEVEDILDEFHLVVEGQGYKFKITDGE